MNSGTSSNSKGSDTSVNDNDKDQFNSLFLDDKIQCTTKQKSLTASFPSRKRRRYSEVEKETLKIGVRKFGKGSWKEILLCYSNIFALRTSCNLRISTEPWKKMA